MNAGPNDLAPALHQTLVSVGTAMAGARDPWWIIASAAAALHGARPIAVHDVDVLLSESDARRLLPEIGLEARPGPDHSQFRSAVFATWPPNPLEVEFMAGFYHHDGAGWIRVEPRSRIPIRIADTLVHVPERTELEALFTSFGRPKDLERAALLRAL